LQQGLGVESLPALTERALADIAESADLLYHLLVLWSAKGVSPQEVWEELDRRFGTSGVAVKEARKKAGGN